MSAKKKQGQEKKIEPSPLSPLTEEERERADRILESSGGWEPGWISDRVRRIVLESLKRDQEKKK
jgi:hypothetical protein